MPQALRRLGWTVRTHHEIFGNRDEEIRDVEWLELCGRENLPALSKDRRLRYRPAEIEAIRRFRVRALVLTAGSLSAAEQAARFDRSRLRIEEACLDVGPFIYAVYVNRSPDIPTTPLVTRRVGIASSGEEPPGSDDLDGGPTDP